MTLRVKPRRVEGRLRAPPSKSHTHRAFILAALSGNGLVRQPLASDDTEATLDGLRGLGFLVAHEAAGVRVGGTLRAPRQALEARASGTTLRLLTCVASLLDAPVELRGTPRLAERPMEPLLAALRELGAGATQPDRGFPVRVRGPLRGGRCALPGGVSSQFISGLLLAAPLAPHETVIHVEGPQASRPYVDVTLAQLRSHGVLVHEQAPGFRVPGAQTVRQRPVDVPGDYSSAAFLLAAAAITKGRVRVDGLDPKDPQGDRAILVHLARLGAAVEQSGDAVTIDAGPLRGADIDVGATPDLFPVLAAVAACARGTTRLHGAPHLRAKESDRIRAVHDLLTRFGIRSQEQPDGLVVEGGTPHGAEIPSAGDHRVAMAGVVLALAAHSESTLADPGVIAKSYPRFLDDLVAIAPGVTA